MAKNKHAQALGKLGGEARAKKMSPKDRSEASRQAVQARWAKYRKKKKSDDAGAS